MHVSVVYYLEAHIMRLSSTSWRVYCLVMFDSIQLPGREGSQRGTQSSSKPKDGNGFMKFSKQWIIKDPMALLKPLGALKPMPRHLRLR